MSCSIIDDMTRGKNANASHADDAAFDTVPLSGLRRGRRGKHHELMKRILKDLEKLPSNSAMRIPLRSMGDVTVANLRSAVNRAASSRDIGIGTSCDDDNFYIWKKTTPRSSSPKT